MDNPREVPGLAHLVEHLMADNMRAHGHSTSFLNYVSHHSGKREAVTYPENTEYSFELPMVHFTTGLELFADLFVNPLITNERIVEEVEAIEREFQGHSQADLFEILQGVANPKSPFSAFFAGNRETLGAVPRENGLDMVKLVNEFIMKHYSSHQMKLVIRSRQPLDVLEELVKEHFGKISRRIPSPSQEDRNTEPLFAAEQLGTLVEIPSANILAISWPIERVVNWEKPYNYILKLIAATTENSFLHATKASGWVDYLASIKVFLLGKQTIVSVAIKLTDAGVPQWFSVVESLFSYLSTIKKEGLNEPLYKTITAVEEFSFMNTIEYDVKDLARKLQLYPADRILDMPYVSRGFNKELLESALNSLRVENCLLLLGNHLLKSRMPDLISPFYLVPIWLTRIHPDVIQHLHSVQTSENSQFSLPPVQEIPDPHHHQTNDSLNESKPVQLMEEQAGYRLFYGQTRGSGVASTVALLLRPPSTTSITAEDRIRYEFIFNHAFIMYVQELAFQLASSAIDVKVNFMENGLLLVLQGPSAQLKKATSLFLKSFAEFQVTMSLSSKDANKANFLNAKVTQVPQSLFALLGMFVVGLLQGTRFYDDSLLPAIVGAESSAEELEAKRQSYLNDVFVDVIVRGAMSEEDARDVLAKVKEFIPSERTSFEIPCLKLIPPQKSLYYFGVSATNKARNAVGMILQVDGGNNGRNIALATLYKNIALAPFFDALRRERKLAYALDIKCFAFGSSAAIVVPVQSDYNPAYVEQHIEDFLQKSLTLIDNMSEETIETAFKSLVHEPAGIDQDLYKILYSVRDFSIKDQPPVTKEELLSFVRDVMAPGGTNRRKISIQLWDPESLDAVREHLTLLKTDPNNIVFSKSLSEVAVYLTDEARSD